MNILRVISLGAMVASLALAGCNREEAKAPPACDKTKSAECAQPGKKSTETNLGGLAKALKP